MKVVSHQEVDPVKWLAFVLSHSQGSVFHTPFAIKLFEGLKGHSPFGMFLIDNRGEIVALLTGDLQTVKQGVLAMLSRRIVLYASPLLPSHSHGEALMELNQELGKLYSVYTEIRKNYLGADEEAAYCKLGFKSEGHLNILVDLTKDEEQLWKEVHSKRRNEIRKAGKKGLTVREFGIDEVPAAHTILREVYDRAKLPLFPVEFFQKGFEGSNNATAMKGFGAYYEGKMVGCMITLCFREIIYDLFAGSLHDYYSKNPNDLIPWEVFRWGKANGYTLFDFGGAGKPDEPYGVRDYKLKFGGELVNLGRFYQIRNKSLFRIAKIGFKIMQSLNRI